MVTCRACGLAFFNFLRALKLVFQLAPSGTSQRRDSRHRSTRSSAVSSFGCTKDHFFEAFLSGGSFVPVLAESLFKTNRCILETVANQISGQLLETGFPAPS